MVVEDIGDVRAQLDLVSNSLRIAILAECFDSSRVVELQRIQLLLVLQATKRFKRPVFFDSE